MHDDCDTFIWTPNVLCSSRTYARTLLSSPSNPCVGSVGVQIKAILCNADTSNLAYPLSSNFPFCISRDWPRESKMVINISCYATWALLCLKPSQPEILMSYVPVIWWAKRWSRTFLSCKHSPQITFYIQWHLLKNCSQIVCSVLSYQLFLWEHPFCLACYKSYRIIRHVFHDGRQSL